MPQGNGGNSEMGRGGYYDFVIVQDRQAVKKQDCIMYCRPPTPPLEICKGQVIAVTCHSVTMSDAVNRLTQSFACRPDLIVLE